MVAGLFESVQDGVGYWIGAENFRFQIADWDPADIVPRVITCTSSVTKCYHGVSAVQHASLGFTARSPIVGSHAVASIEILRPRIGCGRENNSRDAVQYWLIKPHHFVVLIPSTPDFWLNGSRPLFSCLDGCHLIVLLVISPVHLFPLY